MLIVFNEGGERKKAKVKCVMKKEKDNGEMKTETSTVEIARATVKHQGGRMEREKARDDRKEKDEAQIAHRATEIQKRPVGTVASLAILRVNAGRDNSMRKQHRKRHQTRREKR